jgi:hypothetical protein
VVERCPSLWAPLKNEEVFRPVGGRPSGGDDDEGVGAKKLTRLGRQREGPVRLNEHDDNVLTHNESRRVRDLL